jgi:peptidoglycan-N-acetylglucosamine deacetylase
VDVLERLGVPATFFLQGRWVEAFPDIARSIAAAGHLVGSHGHYHVRMPMLTEAGFVEDLDAAEVAIRHATGVDPRPWFRLPFGAGGNDPAILDRLTAHGYRHAGWHVDVAEWDTSATVESVEAGVVEGVDANGDAAVVLLHTWPDVVPDAVEGSIGRLADVGTTFVRLDELEDPPTAPPWE